MPRTCTVCTHKKRQEIDSALVACQPYRRIATHFETSEAAIRRHKVHLPGKIAKAHEAKEIARADSLLDQVRDLQDRTLAILRKAEGAGDLRTATAAIGQARQNLELLAKMAGELRDGTTVNVLVAPEWVAVRQLVVDALEPFPEARVAVATVLGRLNGHPDV